MVLPGRLVVAEGKDKYYSFSRKVKNDSSDHDLIIMIIFKCTSLKDITSKMNI